MAGGVTGDGYFKETSTKGGGACCAECLADSGCAAYTFDGAADSKESRSCFLKDNTRKGGQGRSGTRSSGTVPGRHPKPHPSPSPPHHHGGGGAVIEDVITGDSFCM